MKISSNAAHGGMPAREEASSAEMLGSNSEIARLLKRHHDDLMSLDVPDRFAEQLRRLEQAEMDVSGRSPAKAQS